MKTNPPSRRCVDDVRRAFTLVELLVVISIIAVLAGLVVMVLPGIKIKSSTAAATAQMKALQSAILSYQVATGSYPPDNPTDPARSPLVFELLGGQVDGPDNVTTTGLRVATANVMAVYGVEGFQNVAVNGSTTKNHYPDLKPGLVKADPGGSGGYYFVVPFKGTNGDFNVWNYRSTKPEHNRKSYDLWTTIVVGNRTHTIKNWND